MRIIKSQSKKEILFDNEWITVCQIDDYVYAHESRTDGQGIALLIFRGDEEKPIAGRFEKNPAHGDKEKKLVSLTGGIEKGDTKEQTVVHEAKEEAGIDIDEKDLIYLGMTYPWKGADQKQYLYAINWTGKDLGEPEGDGTTLEEEAYCDWVSLEDAMNTKDPLLHTLLIKAFQKNLINYE